MYGRDEDQVSKDNRAPPATSRDLRFPEHVLFLVPRIRQAGIISDHAGPVRAAKASPVVLRRERVGQQQTKDEEQHGKESLVVGGHELRNGGQGFRRTKVEESGCDGRTYYSRPTRVEGLKPSLSKCYG